MGKEFSFKYLKNDISAGVVVFLVALPLCLGIALASGAPFFSGIISGIIGGVVIGILSGSRLSVSGPAAGLAALVLAAISSIGDFSLFLCAVLIAGFLQIALGLAKLGGIANYFPSSVIKGMLTSIGILIIAKQIPHAFGHDRNQKGTLGEIFVLGNEDWHDLLLPLHHIDLGVTMICFISIAIIILWEKPFIKMYFKSVPGALVAVIVSVLISELLKFTGSSLIIESDHLVQLKAASSPAEFISFFTLPDFAGFTNSKVIVTGIMIAIIASLETLLSIEAVDNLDPERQVTNNNRELIAQGIGNSIAGLIGGLPVTSVIVRSSANIDSGAKTKLSAIFHGLLLFFCIIAIPGLLNKIPLASLAAILLVIGYKLSKISMFKQMIKNGKYQYIPFFVTIATILSIDLFGLYLPLKGEGLLVGVIVGLFTAFGAILHGNLKNSFFCHKETKDNAHVMNLILSEELSFLNKASIREMLDDIPENTIVNIDAAKTQYIDFDVLELIKEFRDIKAPLKNIQCSLLNFKEEYSIENKFNLSSGH
jgi:MFS superfamily sulfate permease-like transporter